jgi:hypothetical protein
MAGRNRHERSDDASEEPSPMVARNVATARTYTGLFLVTLATLMFEILLTRIFSVTLWYHYAFIAISVALFGMTAGAVLVYLLPGRSPTIKPNPTWRSARWASPSRSWAASSCT